VCIATSAWASSLSLVDSFPGETGHADACTGDQVHF
jgi:hypothetical protein